MSEARAAIPDQMQSGLPPPAAPDVVLPSPNVGGEPPDAASRGSGPKSPLPLDVRQAVMQKLIAAGATPQAAIGIGARIQDESGFNPEAIGDSGTSFGLFQHHNDRAERLMQFAAAQGKSPRDPMVQTDFAISEMKGGDPQATQGAGSFMKATDPAQAYRGFTKYFERPATLRDQWMGTVGLSPEARAIAGASQQHFEQFAQQQGDLRKQIERIEADRGYSPERRKTLAELRQQSHDMSQRWSELTSRPPVEKPVDMLANFGSLSTALVMLGGFAGRHHLNIALAAAGTMMQGINANNHQQFQQAYKQWENQATMGLKMIELQRQEIRDVMDDAKLERDEKHARLETLFRMNGMNFQAESLRENNDMRLLQIQTGLDKTLATTKSQMDGIKMQVFSGLKAKYLADGMDDTAASSKAAQEAGILKVPGGGQQWSKEAISAAVEQGLRGDTQALTSLPRSGPARQQYEEELGRRLAASEGGIEGGTAQMMMNRLRMSEAKAAASTAGRITMNTELYSQEAAGAGKLVVEASKEYPRYETLKFNQLLNAYETQTGDPRIIKFGTAINALLNAYGKMSNPSGTGVHDADKERLAHIMDTALSHGQIEAGVDQIIKEGRNVSTAAENAQREVLARIVPKTGLGQEPPPAPSNTAAAPKYSVGQIIDHGGKKYRVTGGDMNDPDVEPVQ